MAATFAIAGCDGPVGPIAGGRLVGDSAAVPSRWSGSGAGPTLEIETRPERPYSVKVNYYVVDGRLYVEAGPNGWSRWRGFLAANPAVRVRLDGRIYDVVAVPVTDAVEIAAVLPAFYALDKDDPPAGCSITDSRPECVAGLRFVRLEARAGPAPR